MTDSVELIKYFIAIALLVGVLCLLWFSYKKEEREIHEIYKKYPKYDPRIKKDKAKRVRRKTKGEDGLNPSQIA